MRYYLGTFLIALATLALEVTVTRILSVVTWYHLAFFAISTAMLGMTGGAVTVYLTKNRFTPDRLAGSLAASSLCFGVATPLSLILLCLLPLDLVDSTMGLAALITATCVCSLPFYFSGIAIAAVLTRSGLPIGRLYAADLIGASSGCLLVLGGLEILDAPSLMMACGGVGILASLSFAWSTLTRKSALGLLALLVATGLLVPLNASTSDGIRPVVTKGRIVPPSAVFLERWNSYSRVLVSHRVMAAPQLWGPSMHARSLRPTPQYHMNIDGQAGTTIRRYTSLADIAHLQHDVTNAAYYLRSGESACVIGVGGGKDILAAHFFGHERILGLDVNPIFIDLLEGEFREFSGIDRIEGLQLVADEARSYLTRTDSQFDVIQMSLIDTWAATGAGAFSLSENALYTVEAWQVFLERLRSSGIFTVSRCYNPRNLGETGRIVSLAVATLLNAGVEDPTRHMAMVTSGHISTLLLSKAPLTDDDIGELKKLSVDLGYQLPILPGIVPDHGLLRRMVSCNSVAALIDEIEHEPFNYAPPTDDTPYFFNMLKPFSGTEIPEGGPSSVISSGVIAGNLAAASTLSGLMLSLCLLTAVTVVIPLLLGRRNCAPADRRVAIMPGAVYFSLIGAGFMIVEIALIQKMSLFLGHPIYALGVILSTLIASTGVGSFLSDRIKASSSVNVFLPLGAAAMILLLKSLMSVINAELIAEHTTTKVVVVVAAIAPTGIMLGLFFPLGMRQVERVASLETPWYWALNGIFGVLSSTVAVVISISWGIGTNFYVSAICYALLPPFILRIRSHAAMDKGRSASGSGGT